MDGIDQISKRKPHGNSDIVKWICICLQREIIWFEVVMVVVQILLMLLSLWPRDILHIYHMQETTWNVVQKDLSNDYFTVT